MALNAIPYRRRVNFALDVSGILVGVASDAERLRRGGDQFHARDVLVHANFVATGAAGRNRGVGELALGFVRMALGALGRIGIFVQRNGMDAGKEQACASENRPPHNKTYNSGHNCLQGLQKINARQGPKTQSAAARLALAGKLFASSTLGGVELGRWGSILHVRGAPEGVFTPMGR